jgi:hypothetical protein
MLASERQVAALVGLFKGGTKLTYRKGEFIIRPGETPSAVFYIESGLVKAYNISKYGEENLLIIRKEHEIFPLIWAITGQEREIIYQAMAPTIVWRISPLGARTISLVSADHVQPVRQADQGRIGDRGAAAAPGHRQFHKRQPRNRQPRNSRPGTKRLNR